MSQDEWGEKFNRFSRCCSVCNIKSHKTLRNDECRKNAIFPFELKINYWTSFLRNARLISARDLSSTVFHIWNSFVIHWHWASFEKIISQSTVQCCIHDQSERMEWLDWGENCMLHFSSDDIWNSQAMWMLRGNWNLREQKKVGTIFAFFKGFLRVNLHGAWKVIILVSRSRSLLLFNYVKLETCRLDEHSSFDRWSSTSCSKCNFHHLDSTSAAWKSAVSMMIMTRMCQVSQRALIKIPEFSSLLLLLSSSCTMKIFTKTQDRELNEVQKITWNWKLFSTLPLNFPNFPLFFSHLKTAFLYSLESRRLENFSVQGDMKSDNHEYEKQEKKEALKICSISNEINF